MLRPDLHHDLLVVIPTVAHPGTLIPTLERLVRHRPAWGHRLAVVLVANGPDAHEVDEAIRQADQVAVHGLNLHVVRQSGPIGFGAALNRGIAYAVRAFGGLPDLTLCLNDDAHVTAGWADRLLAAYRTDVVHGYSEPWRPDGDMRRDRPVTGYGRIGLVGPVSNLVAGIQQVTAVVQRGGRVVEWRGDPDAFAAAVAERWAGQRVTCDFLSGFAVAIGREALSDLLLGVVLEDDGRARRASRDELERLLAADEWCDLGATGDWEARPDGPWAARHREGRAVDPDSIPDGWVLGPWDEEQYPIAGYEDNDLCVRAELAGWRCVVAADCFVAHVGHQTFDRLFPEAMRGLRNRARYYERWSALTDPPRDLVLGSAWRLKLEVAHDLTMARAAIDRAAQLVDRFAVVLDGNPLDVRDDPRWAVDRRNLQPGDEELLRACSGQGPEAVAAAVRTWIARSVAAAPGSRLAGCADDDPRIRVVTWTSGWDEREQRNMTHAIAEDQGADWVISIDHDEVIENRIVRAHLERLMRHPDPLVRSWSQSWANHWDSSRIVREDRPWGDGGTYVGGMHGFRLWRIPRAEDGSLSEHAPRRIFAGTANGLHCGNSPDHDVTAKRVSAVRFRHFGYARIWDRERKHARYLHQDPHADPALTGNGGRDPYGHLIAEEGMRVSPWVAVNGIGLHVLVHRGEDALDLSRVLDQHHGVVDRVVLVWTDEWSPEDREAVLSAPMAEEAARRTAWEREATLALQVGRPPPPEPVVARRIERATVARLAGSWPATGPTLEQARMAAAYGAEWVHHPLDDNLGAARNAGIRALAWTPGMGWSLFCDLDEHYPDPFADVVSVRRMAEASDAWGWVWSFANAHRGEAPSYSESTRMARLVPGVELTGRVHETFDAAFSAIEAAGRQVILRRAPFVVNHLGLAGDASAMDRKLRRYRRLLVRELEDRPRSSAAWVALGLQLLNDGDERGRECLERAVACGDRGYLGFRELAVYHLRIAGALLGEAIGRAGPSHEWSRAVEPIWRMIAERVPPMPILGSAATGGSSCPPLDALPAFTPADEVTLYGRSGRRGQR